MTDFVDLDARYLELQANSLDTTPKPLEYMDPNDRLIARTPMETLVQSTKAMPEAYATVVPEALSAGAKGTVTGIAGLPGEFVGLASGIMNVVSPKNYKGETHDPNLSILDRFLQGYEAVPIRMKNVDEWLTQQGWEVGEIGEPIKDLLEFIAGGSVTKESIKGTVSGVKKLGEIFEPDTNSISNVKKKFKDRHSEETIIHNVYSKDGILSDETGKPMTFYHGTMEKFDEFDLSKSRKPVVYFANKEEVAKQYTTQKGSRKKGTIKAANLKMDKPFIVTDFEFTSGLGEDMAMIYNKIMNKIKNTYEKSYPSNQWSVDEDTVRRLKNKGYDGIIVPEEANPRRQAFYMVFDTDQIKVINNGK